MNINTAKLIKFQHNKYHQKFAINSVLHGGHGSPGKHGSHRILMESNMNLQIIIISTKIHIAIVILFLFIMFAKFK